MENKLHKLFLAEEVLLKLQHLLALGIPRPDFSEISDMILKLNEIRERINNG